MAEKQCNLLKNGGGMSKYSTSEVFTGDYWIDGKPIYRKCCSSSISADGVIGDLKISDIDTLVRISATANDGTDAQPNFYLGSTEQFRVVIVSTGILVQLGSSKPRRPVTIVVVVEYTKP